MFEILKLIKLLRETAEKIGRKKRKGEITVYFSEE